MEYIDTQRELSRLGEALRDEELIAFDTEAAGFHRYSDDICLVQVSTRSRTYLVDALAVEDLGPLDPALTDPGVEIVFHDADFDLRLLHRDHGITVGGLFDTKIAAQFLGEDRLGLANVLETHLDITLAKKHQRADWARRPLPPDMLEYAALDTRHLPALRDLLRDALEARGRLAWAREEFQVQEGVRWSEDADGPAFLDLKGARDLSPRELAVLRELYDWREERARSLDRAPFRVLSNQALLEAAERRPGSVDELLEIRGVSQRVSDKYGRALLDGIRRGEAVPQEELPRQAPRPPRPPPDPVADATYDRIKPIRDRRARQLGLDRGFLMPRSQLEQIAKERPEDTGTLAALPGVRDWQVQALGEEIVNAIRENGSDSGRSKGKERR